MFGKKTTEFGSQPSPLTHGVSGGALVVTPTVLGPAEGTATYLDSSLETASYREARNELLAMMLDQLDFQAMESMSAERKQKRVAEAADKLLPTVTIPLTQSQMKKIKEQALDEILGFGPIEPLLKDPEVSDIMINTAKRVFIEKHGKILMTDITFASEKHLLAVVQRIVSRVGRRIDEANPMVDARMPDGSRFNAIIPPLALDGCLVSIRKFKPNKMPLVDYLKYDSMSPEMVAFLQLASYVRLNIVISGGTGSGKTTLLNALSGHIDLGERVITIEDAAELQLHQPHVLRLETRPAGTEGRGEITQRQLVKNALRMRPDRIILGEMRGEEVIDVLSAMNTGHDGSMATIHANSPKDCLSRLENLVAMSSVQVGSNSLRAQIASAVQIIVQIQRMRDGRRRITQIEELTGFDGTSITTQTLFSFVASGMNPDGTIAGSFVSHNVRPLAIQRAEYFGVADEMLATLATGT